jgi:hypothetical protein
MLTSHNLNAAIKNLEEPDQLSGGVNSFDARTTTIAPTLTEQYDPDSSTNWKIWANLLEELYRTPGGKCIHKHMDDVKIRD